MTRAERAALAAIPEDAEEKPPCPFLSRPGEVVPCWKKGGVCSLRSYERDRGTGVVQPDQRGSTLRAVCPSRFEQDDAIYPMIATHVLRNPAAEPVGQVNFLERVPLIGGPAADVEEANAEAEEDEEDAQEGVGRFDNVMIVRDSQPLEWCAVEIQAVYFSGRAMGLHFQEIRNWEGDGLPWPGHTRRPDYRSSAPKRLMPQLLIKAPHVNRWGKKIAVVIDVDFFHAMGQLARERDVSNSEIVWIVVRFEERDGTFRIGLAEVAFTTLDASTDALIAGRPPTQDRFEQRIRAKLPVRDAAPNPSTAQ
jgi:hypothetical protein